VSRFAAKAAATANPRPRKTASPGVPPVVRFRLRVTAGDVIAIGPGKVSLLEAIGETGSLTAAAKNLGMSYRRAWMLLDQLNRSLAQPAVDSAKGGLHGGGSELTATGRRLIELYRRIDSTAARACADDIAQMLGLLAR
jgi:molybdate transport system regulatory protein